MLLKILDFFSLLDESGKRLSITNLAVIIAITKLAVSHSNPVDAGALFATVLNYAHRRYVGTQGDSTDAKTGQTGT